MAIETDSDAIDKKVENEFVDLAAQLESEKVELAEQVKLKNAQVDGLEERVSKLEVARNEDRQDYDKSVRGLKEALTLEQGKNRDLQTKLEDAKEELGTERDERSRAEQSLMKQRKAVIRWSIYLAVLFIVTLILWLHPGFRTWEWLANHKNRVLMKIGAQASVILFLLNIPLGQHWKVWIPLGVSSVLAILALASL
jgi:hypothetical protein